jgi:hypothetical protein
MRTVTVALLAALSALPGSAQDDDVSTIVGKVDEALGPFRDANLTVTGTSRSSWFPLIVQGGVKLKIRRTGEAVLSATFDDRELAGGRVSYRAVMGADQAVFEVRPWLDDVAQGRAAPLHLRARMAMTPAAFADADLLVLPTAYPVRLFIDEPLLYYAMAPKRYFALVPELKIVAREPELVLHSRVLMKEPIKALGVPMLQAAHVDRRFVIDPKTHRLERVMVRVDLGRGMYGTMMSSRVTERDARGLPTKIEVREAAVQQGNVYDREAYTRLVAYDAVDKGFDLPGFDASLAYADAVLKSSSVYAKAVERAPEDANAHASLAASRLWPKRVVAGMLDSTLKAASDEKALDPLEAVARLCPKDTAAALNVLALQSDAAKRAQIFEGATGELAVARAADAFLREDAAGALAALPSGDLPEFAAATARRIRAAALVRAGRAGDAVPLIEPESLALLSIKDVAALEAELLRTPAEGASLALARHLRVEPERAAKVLAKLLSGASEECKRKAGVLAVELTATSLADALAGTAYGLMLAGKPAEALAALSKQPRRAEDAPLASAVAVALSKGGDADTTLRAVELFLELDPSGGEMKTDADTPFSALAAVFESRRKPHEVAKLIAGSKTSTRQWHAFFGFQRAGQQQAFAKAAATWAQENPKATEDVLDLAWTASALAFGNASAGAPVLAAAAGAGADDPRLLLELAFLTPDLPQSRDLYAKVLSKAPAESRAAHVLRAVESALRTGHADRAKEFAPLAPASVDDAPTALKLARALADAGDADRAMSVARGLEHLGRRPFVLFGQIAESKQDYEAAVRWYNRDVREGADALELEESEEGSFRRRKLTAGEAKKALMKKIGEDWFVERMLAAPAESLPEADAREVKRLYEQLTSEEIGARDEAEAGLTKFGRRAVSVVRAGLESADEDIRSRVRALLRKWAEPE